jgi:hypothetical protein
VAITRRPANRHTVVATGWTNPQNAYALTGDNVYATLASAKNSTLSGDFGFPDITTSPVLPGTWTSNPQGSTDLRSVAYANGYWVAVGNGGTLYHTTDPTGTWTSNPQGSTTFGGVAYGNGTWVAVGDSGTLRYTTDPTGTWTSNPQGSSALYSVAYGNGTWVAVGNSGALRYATEEPGIPDGSTINSVKVKVEWGMTALVTGGALGLQPRLANANNGTETVKTTTTEEQAEASFSGVTLSDLRVAESSDRIEARIRVTKGSTTSAMTGRLDFCYLEVDFRWPLLL